MVSSSWLGPSRRLLPPGLTWRCQRYSDSGAVSQAPAKRGYPGHWALFLLLLTGPTFWARGRRMKRAHSGRAAARAGHDEPQARDGYRPRMAGLATTGVQAFRRALL